MRVLRLFDPAACSNARTQRIPASIWRAHARVMPVRLGLSAPSLRPNHQQSTLNHQFSLPQDRLVEFVPVVEIVQAHSVAWRGSVVGNAARAQNTLARGVIGVITAHRGVMLLDRFAGKRLGVLLYPYFEFGVRRLVLLDVISYRLFIESECGQSHRIEAFADGRITRSEFTRLLQRNLQPKPRKMDNAKWTGNARADHWDVGVTHSNRFSC